ncbi:hypothetical protein Ciccas_010208 [Cichlidogyrus casuarinus]|uniref:Uncharacterized protein n=1 Tax=Cichlidogyrus casuarinus TaxID=1844966 RepID=A0ABD2PVC7_9PLAT
MYSRALPAGGGRCYGPAGGGSQRGHQLPYQANAEPSVNKKSMKKPKNSQRSSTTKKPIFADRAMNDTTSDEHLSGNGNSHCDLSRTNSARTCSRSINSDDQNTSNLLSLEVLSKVEHIFQKIMHKERVPKAELLAVFYMNHGDVEAWYLYSNDKETVSIHEYDTEDTSRRSRRLELTQRRQCILKQYYDHFYQYVILYQDANETEYYRCVGSDLKRRRAEEAARKELRKIHAKGIYSIPKLFQRITRNLRSEGAQNSVNNEDKKHS